MSRGSAEIFYNQSPLLTRDLPEGSAKTAGKPATAMDGKPGIFGHESRRDHALHSSHTLRVQVTPAGRAASSTVTV